MLAGGLSFNKKMTKRKTMYVLAAVLLLVIISTVTCDWIVKDAAQGRTFDNVENIPSRHTGLLLGTSPMSVFGGPNPYFYSRTEAAAALYHAGKIKRIFISGAGYNAEGYNEPQLMKAELVKAGVPDSVCTLDEKGDNTLASIRNAIEVVGLDSVMVISQHFHNERTIFLAKKNNLDAIAYDAGNYYGNSFHQARQRGRECISRVLAVMRNL